MSTLIFDLPNEVYHSLKGTFSSSQFKDILDDEELFYKKHILRSIERETHDHFDLGTFFHTGILEPDKLDSECVVFPGKIRRGAAWEEFKVKHQGKTIITDKQKETFDRLKKSVRDSKVAMGLLSEGQPEVSLFIGLVIDRGVIFAPKYGVYLDLNLGWVGVGEDIPFSSRAVKIIVKTRADWLGHDFVLDLKSTTGNAKSTKSMMDKISMYKYDLSASLYLDMFNLVRGGDIKRFIWVFASKDYFNSRSYEASERNILVGRKKYMTGILRLAEGIRNNWKFPDFLGVLEPHAYEVIEHLRDGPEDKDLLLL